jgi:hypothetical protein
MGQPGHAAQHSHGKHHYGAYQKPNSNLTVLAVAKRKGARTTESHDALKILSRRLALNTIVPHWRRNSAATREIGPDEPKKLHILPGKDSHWANLAHTPYLENSSAADNFPLFLAC